ncbi:MAG: hypothetical protein RIS21_862 [Planctomycetota bacterium]
MISFGALVRKALKLDPLVLIFAVGIALFGIHAIDLGMSETTPRPLAAIQWNYFLLGTAVMIGVGCVPYSRWVALGPLAWGALLVLLIGVAVAGTTVNGSRRWLSLGGFQFQPSEPMKTALILVLAKCLDRGEPVRTVGRWLPLLLFAVVPFGLVVRQPDLGTALMYVPIALAVLFVAGLPLRVVGSMFAAGIVLAFAAFRWFLHPYQRERIISTFFRENLADYEKAREGFQLLQSLRAVGLGGMRGNPDPEGTLSGSGALPESYNDFVFATVSENYGFVGASLLLAALLCLVLACFRVGFVCRDPAGKVICTGVGTLFAVQTLVNAGVALGVVPTTGIALPLVSSGGSALVAMMAALGLVLSVSVHPSSPLTRGSME